MEHELRHIDSFEDSNSPEEMFRVIAYGLNDERKLLLLITLYSLGDALGITGIQKEMWAQAETKLPGHSSNIDGYIAGMLTAGVIDKTETEIERIGRTEIVPGYIVNQKGEQYVALAGGMLEWSLSNPDFTLNQVFGIPTHGGGQPTALRYYVLKGLVEEGEDTVSIMQLAESTGLDDDLVRLVTERLAQHGILERETTKEKNRRAFQIINPDYQPGHRPVFERLRPETRLLYSAIKQAYDLKPTWEIDEFFQLCAELNPGIDPDLLHKARLRLVSGNRKNDRSFSPNIIFTGLPPDDSSVGLSAAAKKPTAEMVRLIKDFMDSNPEALNTGRQSAEKILSEPETYQHLYHKARNRSNFANADHSLDDKLLSIMKRLGGSATARVMRLEYVEESGRKVTLTAIKSKLEQLLAEEKISVNVQPRSVHNRRPENMYTINQED